MGSCWSLRQSPSHGSLSFWCVLVTPDIPWLADTALQSACNLTWLLPRCVSTSFLLRTPVLLDVEPTLNQYDLILINYIGEDPGAPKTSHILRFWVDISSEVRGHIQSDTPVGGSLGQWSPRAKGEQSLTLLKKKTTDPKWPHLD